MAKNKLWQGRFSKNAAVQVESFTQSIAFDKRLALYDIKASQAHVRMLAKCRIISGKEMAKLVQGLSRIKHLIETGRFPFSEKQEDVHMNIETYLIKLTGETGKKVHTGRSRNDQVLADVYLYLRDEVKGIISLLNRLQKSLIRIAEKNMNLIIPGYTHLQQAQPVLASHYFLAHFFKIQRVKERFAQNLESLDVLPLGVGALAGVNYPTDRTILAKLLGFSRVSLNSMDTVSNRDFIMEFLFNCAVCGVHLSQLSEDLIIWNTQEFRFIEIDDAYTTGSSIMPNKKNPDVLELTRGKSASLIGYLNSMLILLKGLPLTYNRDLQEDKVILFHAVDTFVPVLKIMPDLLGHITFNKDEITRKLKSGFMLATDLADHLVKQGTPFRTAHRIVGQLIRYCHEKKKSLFDLTQDELKKFARDLSGDVSALFDYGQSVKRKASSAGTSLINVREQMRLARRLTRE
ncbi:MAG: argininosuccinate lyase [bacterium]|nr:argininosuccinate lyase [bacterium]